VEQGQPLDLVILDLMMPREDGAAVYRKLRTLRPQVPVLVCTGQLADDPAPTILQDGAAGIVRKPFRMTELWYAVRQALQPGEA
jgi:DNA-binding response OmpR family regulator